jgi:SLOG cluster2
MKTAFLSGWSVGISISDSADLAVLGLGKEHLDDAMTEIARHLIACGASLAYGGDLRDGGFTELLFEIVNRYRLNKDGDRILVSNYLAWPVHASMTAAQIEKRKATLEGLAELILLTLDGKKMEASDRPPDTPPPDEQSWVDGLTAMRVMMASSIDARIVLGGQTAKFKGRLPGIAEEALIQIDRNSPLFVLGGFGGCSFDIGRAIGIDRRELPTVGAKDWKGIEEFRGLSARDLHNGLTSSENQRLAETVHIDEAVALILRGFSKMKPKSSKRATVRRS